MPSAPPACSGRQCVPSSRLRHGRSRPKPDRSRPTAAGRRHRARRRRHAARPGAPALPRERRRRRTGARGRAPRAARLRPQRAGAGRRASRRSSSTARDRVQRRAHVPARRTARSRRSTARRSTARSPPTCCALARAHGIEAGWFELDGWHVRRDRPGRGRGGDADRRAAHARRRRCRTASTPPYKLMCIATTEEETAALHALRDRLPGTVTGVFSHPRYLEVTAPGIDKARAVRAAAARLGPRAVRARRDRRRGERRRDAARGGRRDRDGQRVATSCFAATPHRTAANDRDGVALAIDALLAAR